MAPWIRVNGSVNRRVLDKYAGTILLHCIENVGLTLFTLCTRFHYLLPIHVHEIVQVCISNCLMWFQFIKFEKQYLYLNICIIFHWQGLLFYFQYLEEFECITKTAMAKQKPITLFSKYESVKTGNNKNSEKKHTEIRLMVFVCSFLGPATDLDDFQDIAIEPTIDAFSKLSCFIGTKKYKEDFIWNAHLKLTCEIISQ